MQIISFHLHIKVIYVLITYWNYNKLFHNLYLTSLGHLEKRLQHESSLAFFKKYIFLTRTSFDLIFCDN